MKTLNAVILTMTMLSGTASAGAQAAAQRPGGKLSFGFVAESRDDAGFPAALRGAHQAADDMRAVGLDISIQSWAPAPDDRQRASAIDQLTSGPFPAPVDGLAVHGAALAGPAAAAAVERAVAAGVPVVIFDTETTAAPGAFASVTVDADAVRRLTAAAGHGAGLQAGAGAAATIDRRPYEQGRRCVELMVAKSQGQSVTARETLTPTVITSGSKTRTRPEK